MTDEHKTEKNNVAYRDIVRFALHYWRPDKWMGLSAAGLMLSCVALDAVIPVYTGKIVDALTGGDSAAATQAAWKAFGMFILLMGLQPLLRMSALALFNAFAVRNLAAIVNDGLRKVQRFSSDWHANTFAGGTVRKISRGMWSFDSFEDTLLMGILPAVTIMIASTVTLTMTIPQVGMAASGMILLYCAASIFVSIKILSPRFRASAESDTRVGATLADIITGNPTVKAFGRERHEDALFSDVVKVWQNKSLRAWNTGVIADGGRSVLRLLMTGSTVGASLWLWNTGKATPGDIVMVITTFFILGGYLNDIGRQIAQLQRAMSDMEDAVGFWLREEEVRDTENARTLTVGRARRHDLISFDRVGFRYPGNGKEIYQDMSIDIATGEHIALVGASGSGKSTFVKLIQRLYNLSSGAIRIDGQDISQTTLESLRRSIALVPQEPVLFHRSLAENLAYGNPDATMEEIVAAAKKAYAHDFIMTLEKGYETLVGERGVKLSGGERQRVAIARAILTDAPILIMDEATSSLDSVSEHFIQKALEALMQGRTTITIAHRLSTIRKSDRILVFERGRIIEQGNHDALMARSGSAYKRLHDMQALDLVDDGKASENIEEAKIA